MTLQPGTRLGHYEITSLLGSGGMGEVYRAKDEHLSRDVAIKVLPTGTLADEHVRQRFRKEALALSKLNHPNIATVHDFDTEESVDFIVMELVEGTSLAEKVKTGPLLEKEISDLGAQIADALEEAHERGIVHRDLKPGNIAVNPKDRVKVLDFGLAKMLRPVSDEATTEALTQDQAVAGTLPYMSPEELRGEKADHRSDLFSFGVVLYEMATGRRPFEHTLSTALADAIIHKAPDPPSTHNRKVSPGLESIITKSLDKNPDHRYQSAREMRVDLERLAAPVSGAAPKKKQVRAGRWLLTAACIVAVAAFLFVLNVGGLRDRWVAQPGPRIDSIAVLPLENLSGDPEQEYFADGMTDELISQLAQIGSLRVISRTSIMQYKEVRKSLPEIARDLDVDVVVEGTVRRAEGRVRITAQLVEASTDRHMWAQSFERELRDVLALQSQMAREIAREIRASLTPEEAERFAVEQTTNPEAYEAYLKGRYHFQKTDEDGFERSLAHFKVALEIDRDFALAYAGRAASYINLELWAMLRPGEGFGEARRAALSAINLDETLAEAHTALAVIQYRHDWDFQRAESTFRRAIALNPSYFDAHVQYCYFLMSMERYSEAIEQAKEAKKLDPLMLMGSWVLALSYLQARQYDLALSAFQDSSKRWPGNWSSTYGLARIYRLMERLPEALSAAQTSVELSARNPWTLAQLGYIYGLLGRNDDALAILDELQEKRSRRHIPALALAWVNTGLGEKDRAVKWLEIAYEEREGWLVSAPRWPLWDSLRDHPGFVNIFRRMNLPE